MSDLLNANFLLASLPVELHEHIQSKLSLQSLELEHVLHRAGTPTDLVYFPISGVVSLLTVTEDGRSIQAALIGREGMVGVWVALGMVESTWQTIVQGRGEAFVMTASDFAVVAYKPEFRHVMLGHAGASFAMATQSVVCNRFHGLSARTARWLLLMRDRLDSDDFVLTHASLASMLGVHRPAVTVALRTLVASGLIEQSGRRMLRIMNRAGLENAACECYARAIGMPQPA